MRIHLQWECGKYKIFGKIIIAAIKFFLKHLLGQVDISAMYPFACVNLEKLVKKMRGKNSTILFTRYRIHSSRIVRIQLF